MTTDLLHTSIVVPAVLVPVDVIAVALTLWALVGPARRRRSGAVGRGGGRRAVAVRFAVLAVGAVVGLGLVWWFGDVQDAFGVAFTPVTRMWVAFACAAVAVFVVVLVQGGSGRRMVALGAALAVVLAAALGVNVDFGAYRTVQQAITPDPYPTGDLGHEHGATAGARVVDATSWRAPSDMPRHGLTMSVHIPATVSHFHARGAVLWLPPAARVADPPTLPVLVALSGQPGQPADLFQAGGLGRLLDRYAATHHGLAPIVVAPDQLGAPARNPMCLDTEQFGRSATYVMTDTVAWIRAHLDVGAAPDAWGITGFSQGATCTMQFSAAHPGVFGTALAISSELAPMNGSQQHTVQVGFGGSESAYREATPLALMARHAPYRDHLTVFGYGQDDAPYAASAKTLHAAAARAGMTTSLIVSPGSAHDWNTVHYVLAHGLPAVLTHLGLPGDPSGLRGDRSGVAGDRSGADR